MSQFTVIDNPALTEGPIEELSRSVEEGDAGKLIAGRQFHVLGTDADATFECVNANYGGAFLAHVEPQNVAAFRHRNPSVPVIMEPRSIRERVASGADIFFAADGSRLTQRGLIANLDEQRLRGGDLAMIPAGQIPMVGLEVIREIISQANELDRTDLILPIALEGKWLTPTKPEKLDGLVRTLNLSRHPIALAYYDAAGNALSSMVRMMAHRTVISSITTPTIAYRVGPIGFDAFAHGAAASAVGHYPTTRGLKGHNAPAGGGTYPPKLLIGDMLDFVASKDMREQWFPAVMPFTCDCQICDGAPVDRLYAKGVDRAIGHQHNALEIDRVFASLRDLRLANRPPHWKAMAVGAVDTYLQLSAHIGRRVEAPNAVKMWAGIKSPS